MTPDRGRETRTDGRRNGLSGTQAGDRRVPGEGPEDRGLSRRGLRRRVLGRSHPGLGGGAGTTRDTFELVAQSERYGARLALFGRKINLAEAPLHLIVLMRAVADGAIGPEEAVRAYHGDLQKLGLTPNRSLADDRVVTEDVLTVAAAKAA